MSAKTKKTNTKNKKKKQPFNMYQMMHKNKKKIIMCVCSILVVTLVAGIFAQFAFMS